MMNQQNRMVGVMMVALAAVTPLGAIGGEPERSTDDGVYTFTQARRGQEDYRKDCASCHMGDMEGNGQWVPSLAGDSFMAKWNGHPLADLFGLIQSTMPQTAPRSLAPNTYIDIVAYILSSNGLPAGQGELKPDMSSLKKIRIVERRGTD